MIHCSPPHSIPREQTPTEDLPLYVCPFVVIEDDREGMPWSFQNIVIENRLWLIRRQRERLLSGDYTIQGLERELIVERKSASDLVGSITAGNNRLRALHERMQRAVKEGGFACLICEGDLATIHDGMKANWDDGGKIAPDSLIGITAEWPAKYGVPWFFAGDRRRAEILGFRIMLKYWLRGN